MKWKSITTFIILIINKIYKNMLYQTPCLNKNIIKPYHKKIIKITNKIITILHLTMNLIQMNKKIIKLNLMIKYNKTLN